MIDPAFQAIYEKLMERRVFTTSCCWEYTGTRTPPGYGEIYFDGKTWRTHRLMYTILNGPIPDGLHVMHSCDNPPCFNPDHLCAGTHLDNMSDMARKGRQGNRLDSRWRSTGSVVPWECVNGHDMTDPENVYPHPSGTRKCRKCHREAQVRFAARLKTRRRAMTTNDTGAEHGKG